MPEIEHIDIAPLFGPPDAERDACDVAIAKAAGGLGFLSINGMPDDFSWSGALVNDALALFSLPEDVRIGMLRQAYAPDHPNRMRGYFPLVDDAPTWKEGVDIGLHADLDPDPADPLKEPNPWPDEATAPGWRAAMLAYGAAAERIGFALLHSLARGCGLAENHFSEAFEHGASTLRLLRYPAPPRPPDAADVERGSAIRSDGRIVRLGADAHTDSGCVTILNQDASGGLQVEGRDGAWLDVPPRDGALVVNLGDLMERWSGGRYRATRHRVLSPAATRHSIPFFFEPRYGTVIETPAGERIPYEDHMRAKIAGFTEFAGVF